MPQRIKISLRRAIIYSWMASLLQVVVFCRNRQRESYNVY
jgi:hypothetical protein